MEAHHKQSAICERARSWISLRVDDELSEFECALLDAHMARCADCAEFCEDVDSMTVSLRPSRSSCSPVRSSSRSARRRHVALSTRAAASAAALLVTIGGTFAVLGHSGDAAARRPSSRVTGNEEVRLRQFIQRRPS